MERPTKIANSLTLADFSKYQRIRDSKSIIMEDQILGSLTDFDFKEVPDTGVTIHLLEIQTAFGQSMREILLKDYWIIESLTSESCPYW